MEFTGTGFCVGDNVTFDCDEHSNDHVWTIAGEQISIVRAVTWTLTGGPDRRSPLAVVRPLPIDSTITTPSVIAYSGFNGVNISCFSNNGVIVEPQTSTCVFNAHNADYWCPHTDVYQRAVDLMHINMH